MNVLYRSRIRQENRSAPKVVLGILNLQSCKYLGDA
jgi:hypothetical protein